MDTMINQCVDLLNKLTREQKDALIVAFSRQDVLWKDIPQAIVEYCQREHISIEYFLHEVLDDVVS